MTSPLASAAGAVQGRGLYWHPSALTIWTLPHTSHSMRMNHDGRVERFQRCLGRRG